MAVGTYYYNYDTLLLIYFIYDVFITLLSCIIKLVAITHHHDFHCYNLLHHCLLLQRYYIIVTNYYNPIFTSWHIFSNFCLVLHYYCNSRIHFANHNIIITDSHCYYT